MTWITFVVVLIRDSIHAQTSWSWKKLGRKGFIQLTFPHCCSSLKEVRTGTQTGQEAGADAEARNQSCIMQTDSVHIHHSSFKKSRCCLQIFRFLLYKKSFKRKKRKKKKLSILVKKMSGICILFLLRCLWQTTSFSLGGLNQSACLL